MKGRWGWPPREKSIHLVKNGDALKILVDSILEKGEVPSEELESSKDNAYKNENYSAVAKMALPPFEVQFRSWGVKALKESKEHKEMDEQWA